MNKTDNNESETNQKHGNQYPTPEVIIEGTPQMSYARRYVTVAILCVVNLLNYIDRYTVAGVLADMQDFYHIGEGDAGLVQTIFVVGFMITSPIFGYCGDRYNRKWLMVGGIALWSVVTMAGSFVPSHLFWVFVLLRGIVGIGEASYSTIAPTLISDMFVKEKRSTMLMCFYFAIPVGSLSGREELEPYYHYQTHEQLQQHSSYLTRYFRPRACNISFPFVKSKVFSGPSGALETYEQKALFMSGLGYVVGSSIADALNGWEWSLRATPVLGAICCILIAVVAKEPPRGMAEQGVAPESSKTLKEDALALIKNKTYVLSTAANSCVTFIAGALGFFAPKFMEYAYRVQGNMDIPSKTVSLYTGLITTAAGFIGTALGTEVAKRVKRKYPNGDPLICGYGMLMSTPFLFGALVISQYEMISTWIMVGLGETMVFMNWVLVVDMLLYTVSATRRATASAMQIFVCHLLGDAASPSILGVISDSIRDGKEQSYYNVFKALQSSLYICLFVGVLAGGFFLISSLFVAEDRAKADAETKGLPIPSRLLTTNSTLPLDDMVPLMDDSQSIPFDEGSDDVPMLQIMW